MKGKISLRNPVFGMVLMILTLLACNPSAQSPALSETDFLNPPASAKPRTWFHVMSGNMTKEGLTKDLEAIERVGIGGILIFNISQGIPNGPVKYNSPEHHELLTFAATECERLGLSFGVHNCDGWTSSGGPWISPEQSMKMVVWSETLSKGGAVHTRLNRPTIREGYYEDIAVLAYPSLKTEIPDHTQPAKITSSDINFSVKIATDNRIDTAVVLQKSGNENPWIQFSYSEPREIRSAYIVFKDRHGEACLQVSEDGVHFKTLRNLYKVRTGKSEWACNDSFDPVKARYFRLLFNQNMVIKEAKLISTLCMHNVLGRTSIARTDVSEMSPIGTPEGDMIIDKNKIRDISEDMDAEGNLITELPEGNWTIIRFGYTSTGAFNHPASEEGRGLECDKFSREAFKIHYDAFAGKLVKETANKAPHAMQFIEIDSYEMGGQNWTRDYESIFSGKKGYDLIKFLPLFTGKFVESAETSEAVLEDIREVNCNLMADNYYGYFTELCHNDGIKSYIEPYGFGPLNDLDVGSKADINMGEFWMNRPVTMVNSAVSASHIYGKNIISSESFTSRPEINWKGNPALAKITGDIAWTKGINEFVFHRFAHQANPHAEPGMTMNRWGFHFDRTQTWWENAGPSWFKYLARGSYMLRQGVPVSDLLIFVGDASPNKAYDRNCFASEIPAGTNFDFVNTDVILNRISLDKGRLILPEGTEYKILALKNTKKLSLKTLKRIKEITLAGIPVVGEKPVSLLGYKHSQADIQAFEKLADEIWKLPNVYSDFDWTSIFQKEEILPDFQITGRSDIGFIHRRVKNADIYFTFNPDSIAQQLECTFRVKNGLPELWNALNGNIIKSAQFENKGQQTTVRLNLDAQESVFVVFRESGKGLVSVTRSKKTANYFISDNNKLFMESENRGVFGAELNTGEKILTEIKNIHDPIKIEGPWEVEFMEEKHYTDNHTFVELVDWKDSKDENIRYFSGTAVYRKTFEVENLCADENIRYILDPGEVKIVAEVILNGKNMGVVWMKPFTMDITDALQPGENHLEIYITNQWTNKLIGDERFPASFTGYRLEGQMPQGKMVDWYVNNEPLPKGKRTTFCTGGFYKANDELMPSGLLGPVVIYQKEKILIE